MAKFTQGYFGDIALSDPLPSGGTVEDSFRAWMLSVINDLAPEGVAVEAPVGGEAEDQFKIDVSNAAGQAIGLRTDNDATFHVTISDVTLFAEPEAPADPVE